ncbi:hypothetical protein HS088_TW15G00822 [Tripterygium wilfordii]|uniref:Uncharacterized protein n=1 Tax=Tripterygium wilfordii TaxID=458696 RepID=A0A7J7CMN9_TRIWF|nr:hypothetical protein HS088_TW15G00822 [Tripterygium wilfordii]
MRRNKKDQILDRQNSRSYMKLRGESGDRDQLWRSWIASLALALDKKSDEMLFEFGFLSFSSPLLLFVFTVDSGYRCTIFKAAVLFSRIPFFSLVSASVYRSLFLGFASQPRDYSGFNDTAGNIGFDYVNT